jgi:hypothetical protein
MIKIRLFIIAVLVSLLLPGAPGRAYYIGVNGELRENQTGDYWEQGATVRIFNCLTLQTIATGPVETVEQINYGTFEIAIPPSIENRTLCVEVDFDRTTANNPPNFVKGPFLDDQASSGILTTGVYSAFTNPIYVRLDFFEPRVELNTVVLKWETLAERDTTAFVIQRSLATEQAYQDISPRIEARGSATTGSAYEYIDRNVQPGLRYYYRLRAFHTNQTQEDFSVVSIVTNPGSAAATLTATNSIGFLATATPVQTEGPPTATPEPTETPTPTEIPNPTETPTLAPLPTLNMLFPALTPTSSPTPTRTPTPPGEVLPTQPAVLLPTENLPPQVELLGGLIILIWLMLGGFLIFYLRRLEG